MDEFWVFGYGSLMWKPGFEHHKRVSARLSGYQRSLCVYSHFHRGTPQIPGLVLGLDRGGFCEGAAFAVKIDNQDSVMRYLRERELVTNVYRELVLPVRLANGSNAPAVTYVVDRAHEQYAGQLSIDRAVEFVRQGHGHSGPNRDYVLNTVTHLQDMGIEDAALETVANLIQQDQPRARPSVFG